MSVAQNVIKAVLKTANEWSPESKRRVSANVNWLSVKPPSAKRILPLITTGHH